jgi:hypothetical protein
MGRNGVTALLRDAVGKLRNYFKVGLVSRSQLDELEVKPSRTRLRYKVDYGEFGPPTFASTPARAQSVSRPRALLGLIYFVFKQAGADVIKQAGADVISSGLLRMVAHGHCALEQAAQLAQRVCKFLVKHPPPDWSPGPSV